MKNLVFHQRDMRKNVAHIKERAGSAAIYAVLTGDGQGAGLVEMAKFLRQEGIGRFAISEPSEAVALRKAGLVEEEILMLRSTTDPEELNLLIDHNVVCTIGSYDSGVALNGLAESRSTIVEAHIQIDTGMGYGGFLADEPDKVLSMYRYLPSVALSGLYTQMHVGNQAQANQQLEVFQEVQDTITQAGFETGTVHAAGSGAFLRYDFAKLDAVRVGSAWLGRCHQAEKQGLIKIGEGQAKVAELRWLPKGHTIGNRKMITLRRSTRVAVLPVGYQNGFGAQLQPPTNFLARLARLFSKTAPSVYIGNRKVRMLGQPGALETLLDVTDLKFNIDEPVTFDMDPLQAKGLPRIFQ